MKYLISLFFFFLCGCSAVGIISSNDPKTKIRQAYYLMDEGRHFPAKKILDEAMVIAKEQNDNLVQASVLTAYGDLYKMSPHPQHPQNVRNLDLSVNSYLEAASILEKLQLKKRQSMAHMGAAIALYLNQKSKDSCKQLDLALMAFQTNSEDDFKVQEIWDSPKVSFAQNVSKYKKDYGCKK